MRVRHARAWRKSVAQRGANIEVRHAREPIGKSVAWRTLSVAQSVAQISSRSTTNKAVGGRHQGALKRPRRRSAGPTALRAVAHANREDNDMTDAREISATFKVGARYRCSTTLPLQKPAHAVTLHVGWQPDVPTRL